jgi:hypothetical protein
MGIIDTTVTVVIVGGVAYFAWEFYENGDFCSGILKDSPACSIAGIGSGFVKFFQNSYDTGDAGIPFGLEDCAPGYTNFGLTCTRCMSVGDCFSGRGCGCNTVGRLDNQKCSGDHPDKVGLLCYKPCPKGWVHVEGMPYLCRDGKQGNFWDRTVGDKWKTFIPFGTTLFK